MQVSGFVEEFQLMYKEQCIVNMFTLTSHVCTCAWDTHTILNTHTIVNYIEDFFGGKCWKYLCCTYYCEYTVILTHISWSIFISDLSFLYLISSVDVCLKIVSMRFSECGITWSIVVTNSRKDYFQGGPYFLRCGGGHFRGEFV